VLQGLRFCFLTAAGFFKKSDKKRENDREEDELKSLKKNKDRKEDGNIDEQDPNYYDVNDPQPVYTPYFMLSPYSVGAVPRQERGGGIQEEERGARVEVEGKVSEVNETERMESYYQ